MALQGPCLSGVKGEKGLFHAVFSCRGLAHSHTCHSCGSNKTVDSGSCRA